MITSIVLAFSLITWQQVPRKNPNPIREYHLCSERQQNCQNTIARLINQAQKSVEIVQFSTFGHDKIGVAVFDAVFRKVQIQALIDPYDKPESPATVDFLTGNDIPTWLDTGHTKSKKKRFIVIDSRIVISGIFEFTGVDGENAEAIEIDTNPTVAGIYQNEFEKHKRHSRKITPTYE
jgi:phospholipase D-like protein